MIICDLFDKSRTILYYIESTWYPMLWYILEQIKTNLHTILTASSCLSLSLSSPPSAPPLFLQPLHRLPPAPPFPLWGERDTLFKFLGYLLPSRFQQ